MDVNLSLDILKNLDRTWRMEMISQNYAGRKLEQCFIFCWASLVKTGERPDTWQAVSSINISRPCHCLLHTTNFMTSCTAMRNTAITSPELGKVSQKKFVFELKFNKQLRFIFLNLSEVENHLNLVWVLISSDSTGGKDLFWCLALEINSVGIVSV